MDYYVIYEKPSDFPKHWVVRKYSIKGDMGVVAHDADIFDTLAGAREHIPPGRIRFERVDSDDYIIVETWI